VQLQQLIYARILNMGRLVATVIRVTHTPNKGPQLGQLLLQCRIRCLHVTRGPLARLQTSESGQAHQLLQQQPIDHRVLQMNLLNVRRN